MNTTTANKLRAQYDGAVVNKGLVNTESMVSGLPLYVSEWLIKKFYGEQTTEDGQAKLVSFINKYLPSRDQKEYIKSMLIRQGRYTILDEFEVTADLKSNRHKLVVKKLDIDDGFIPNKLLDENPRLLSGGIWGAGTLEYDARRRAVTLVKFTPLMIARFNLDLFIEKRNTFSIDEWIDILINSQSLNPEAYPTLRKKLWLLARMLPLVEPNLNIIELGPKGTGKTEVYKKLSYYARVISGGTVTPAVLFYNNQRPPTPGLLVTNDVVVFDEIQTISFPDAGETVGILKDYMNSGSFTRGRQSVMANAGVVMLGNIKLDSSHKPLTSDYLEILPKKMQETAFVDRIHGFIPGWELPKIGHSSFALSYTYGFCADYLSEAFHALQERAEHARLIDGAVEISDKASRRDEIAVKRLATAYVKLLFPHLQVTDEELEQYILQQSLEMRQIIRDQLSDRDEEYRRVKLAYKLKPARHFT